jgi:hypothetical protein
MKIGETNYDPRSGTLHVTCVGDCGVGSEGNPSGELEVSNLPFFDLVRVDETAAGRVLTPVPLKMRVRIPPDETRLSAGAQDQRPTVCFGREMVWMATPQEIQSWSGAADRKLSAENPYER